MNPITLEIDLTAMRPYLRVPHHLIWSLVEYLAFRRILADFTYSQDGFQATFTRLSAPAAQQVLADWMNARMEAPNALAESADERAASAFHSSRP